MPQQTTISSMRDYQAAYRRSASLKREHDALVEQQRELLPLIAQAEAAENKARETMLRAVQENDPNNKNK